MASGIYVIHNTKTGKVYIGQTVDLTVRLIAHRNKLNDRTHHNRRLQADWIAYGEKAFTFKVLEYCELDQLTPREQHYLSIYMPQGICYNIREIACSPRDGHSTREKKKGSHSNGRNTIAIYARGDKEWKARVHAHADKLGMTMIDFVTKALLADLEAKGL